jgi:hypothetical protein
MAQLSLFDLKVCSKCGQALPATTDYFYRKNNARDGLQTWCRMCDSARTRAYYAKTHPSPPKVVKLPLRKSSAERCRRHYLTNKEERTAKQHAYYQAHKAERIAYERAYNKEHQEQIAAYNRAYSQQHRERAAEYRRERLRNSPQLRLDHSMARGIWQGLRKHKSGCHWENLIGYSLEDLMKHLEAHFRPGMTWENYGYRGWHIDHIRPRSTFRFASPDDSEFRECWALDNLQPLWAKDNIRKGDRWNDESEVASNL